MKKFLLACITLLVLLNLLYPVPVYGQKNLGHNIQVSASIGEIYLNLSGIIAPYASVILIADDNYLRSTVADSQGKFSLNDILVKRGFSQFCLEAIDFKR